MKSFKYGIKDKLGIHARPAGMLVKEAKSFSSKVKVKKGENEAEATQMFKLMALGIKKGDEIEVTVEGDDEQQAYDALEKFFSENL